MYGTHFALGGFKNTLKKIRQKFNDYVTLDSWSDGRLILEPSDRHSSHDTLEQTFQDFFQDFTMFSAALVKCSSIASFYNHSTTMKEELFKRQNETGNKENSIEQQVSTRWNSTYMMEESIIKKLDHVNLILSRDEKHKNLQLKSNEAEVLEESLEVLK
ncbi:zinc finger BED domain-containing 4, partial [Brachionus plicatilis]